MAFETKDEFFISYFEVLFLTYFCKRSLLVSLHPARDDIALFSFLMSQSYTAKSHEEITNI